MKISLLSNLTQAQFDTQRACFQNQVVDTVNHGNSQHFYVLVGVRCEPYRRFQLANGVHLLPRWRKRHMVYPDAAVARVDKNRTRSHQSMGKAIIDSQSVKSAAMVGQAFGLMRANVSLVASGL